MLCKIKNLNKNSGLTLVEMLVGIALMLIVFVGIFGMIQMSFKIVGLSKARVTATAIANEKIELARNLTYNDVGTVNGIPHGTIPDDQNVTLNNTVYAMHTSVLYIDDPFDGTSTNDSLPTDYKNIKVMVTWPGIWGGQVVLDTYIAPKGIETTGTGGVISILVFNANGQRVPQADVHIQNNSGTSTIDVHYLTDDSGTLYIPGAPVCDGCYDITVTKGGYSTDKTYASGEMISGIALATPDNPPLSVRLNQMTEVSFSIDELSQMSVKTIKYVDEKNWIDAFDDQTRIDSLFQTTASSTLSAVTLDSQAGQYYASGSLISVAVPPASLVQWGRFFWNDNKPVGTGISYQLLYATNSSWALIPDSDLTINGIKNSDGFTSGPIDLSNLDPYRYPQVKLKANFSTTDLSQTPVLLDWTITWFGADTETPIANVPFSIQGAKTVGKDAAGNPVYKYRQNFTTDGSGNVNIPNLEWDSYTISMNGASTGYDIANSSPFQPINLNPATNPVVSLKLAAHHTNTMLVTVETAGGAAIPGALVRLYGSGYDKQKLTFDSGQAFFTSLAAGSYNLQVSAGGFQNWSSPSPISINGQTQEIVNMTTP